MELRVIGQKAKDASFLLGKMGSAEKNKGLLAAAQEILDQQEKILAAKRAGIKEIILCEENRKNIEEIQPMYLKGLTFHYVSDIKEVLDLALTDEKVNDAIDFCGETRNLANK